MIRAIIVDDEQLSLDRFARMLNEDARIEICGTFTSPKAALEFAQTNSFDIVFLDVEMPGMNGLSLAENILKRVPDAQVVFVTAYDNYALDAFKLHAAGYILKPIDQTELKNEIDFIAERLGSSDRPALDEIAPPLLYVSTLGDFICTAQGQPVTWKTLKAEELFALFIHYNGVAVPKDVLIDKLWPDAEPQNAANLFRVTCTYIRNTLSRFGFENPLIRELNKYRLDISRISCDLFGFLAEAESIPDSDIDSLRSAISLYRGEYFQNMPYDWAIQKRVLLESQFKEMSRISAQKYIEEGDYIRAGEVLTTVLAFDPYDYNTAIEYVKLKLKSGDNDAALFFYREFTDRMIRETGDEPPENFSSLITK